MTTVDITRPPEGPGTICRVHVMHNDAAARERHEQMGVHDRYGTAADQHGTLAGTL